jgi:hypothetical protein
MFYFENKFEMNKRIMINKSNVLCLLSNAGPRRAFFDALFQSIGKIKIIAEDLVSVLILGFLMFIVNSGCLTVPVLCGNCTHLEANTMLIACMLSTSHDYNIFPSYFSVL